MAGFVGVQIPPISTMANLTGRTITALQQQFSGHLRPRHGRLFEYDYAWLTARMRSIPTQRPGAARPGASRGRAFCARPGAFVQPLDHSCSRRRRGLGGVRPCLERVDRLRRAGHRDLRGTAPAADPQRQLDRLAGQRHAVTGLRDTAFALRRRQAHANRRLAQPERGEQPELLPDRVLFRLGQVPRPGRFGAGAPDVLVVNEVLSNTYLLAAPGSVRSCSARADAEGLEDRERALGVDALKVSEARSAAEEALLDAAERRARGRRLRSRDHDAAAGRGGRRQPRARPLLLRLGREPPRASARAVHCPAGRRGSARCTRRTCPSSRSGGRRCATSSARTSRTRRSGSSSRRSRGTGPSCGSESTT